MLNLTASGQEYSQEIAQENAQEHSQEHSQNYFWELVRDKSGIKVYSRNLEHSRYKEFKGEIFLDTPFPAVLGLLNDVEACQYWIHLCMQAKILKENNGEAGFERIIYQITDLIFPAKNRDNIYKATVIWRQDKKSVLIRLESLPEYFAETSYIRVKESYGEYLAEHLDNGLVKLTWKHFVDPGGRLPAFIVNSLSVNIPFKSLRNFRERVELPQYQKLEFDYNESGQIIGFKADAREGAGDLSNINQTEN